MAIRLPAPPHPEWLRPQKPLLCAEDGAKAAHAPPAFASALIVKEDARNVNHAGAIYARKLRKFAQDNEWNRSLFSPSRRRIRKMSISQLSLL